MRPENRTKLEMSIFGSPTLPEIRGKSSHVDNISTMPRSVKIESELGHKRAVTKAEHLQALQLQMDSDYVDFEKYGLLRSSSTHVQSYLNPDSMFKAKFSENNVGYESVSS